MHILMIESNPAGIQGILKALDEKHTVTFLSADPNFYLHESVHAQKAFTDPRCRVIHEPGTFDVARMLETVRKLHAERPIDAVMTYSEYHTIHAAEVAKALGLPGMDPEAARTARFKHLTRAALEAAGVPQPRFRHVKHDRAQFLEAVRAVGFPCIVKPADGTASLGVVHLKSVADAETYFAALAPGDDYGRGVTKSDDLLVEEYVEGTLVSVESCVLGGGEVRAFGITDRRLVGFPHFIEMGGTFFWDHPLREQLFALNGDAIRAIGIDFGFIHMEFILSDRGPLVLESNARLAGGILPRMFEAASGVDPFMEVIQQALGKRPKLPVPQGKTATGRQFGSPVAGTFRKITMDRVAELPGFVEAIAYPKEGASITSLSKSNFDWLGHVIFTGDRHEESLGRAEGALTKVVLAVETPVAI
jgi:cysteine synthase A